MYTEAKMNSAPLLPDGLPQCPSGLLFCEVTRRDELSDKGPYRSQASCYGNRVEGKLLPHPGAPASAPGAVFFLGTASARPDVSPPALASIEEGQQL
jgi:hypothetical protein